MYPSYKRQMVTTLLLDLVSFVLPGNCMCLCVCKCLFFILLHGMRIQAFWLALTTTQKKYIDISNFSNKTLGSEQNPFFFADHVISLSFLKFESQKKLSSAASGRACSRTRKWSLNIFCSNEKPRRARTKRKRRRWENFEKYTLTQFTIQSLFSIHRALSRKLSTNWKRMSIW